MEREQSRDDDRAARGARLESPPGTGAACRRRRRSSQRAGSFKRLRAAPARCRAAEALGGIEPARKAVQQVLRRGGARDARVLDRVAAAGSGCRPLLERTRTPDPYRMALQLGTAEWTITDAARFGLAIGDGTFPASVTRRVTGLLSREKEHSDDPFAHGLDVTSRLDWGAGQAFRGLSPAYKSGWGGSSGETPTFVTEQAIHLRTPSGDYGIAVTFEPPTRPARDDPGLTRAPAALYQLLRGVRQLLEL